MAAPSGFTLRNADLADIPAPVTGKFTVFGSADNPKVKDSTGAVRTLGNGIVSIALVGTVGLLDTYRITFTDGNTYDYDVTNGADGQDGVIQSVNGKSATSITLVTDDIAEDGSPVNLWFTDERAQDATGTMVTGNTEDGMSVIYDDASGKLNFTNTDKGSTAVATHEAAPDPHPQYLTSTEGNAAYTPLSHVGTGGGQHALATPNTSGGAGGTGGSAGFLSAAGASSS